MLSETDIIRQSQKDVEDVLTHMHNEWAPLQDLEGRVQRVLMCHLVLETMALNSRSAD